jgi:hypothetical protein
LHAKIEERLPPLTMIEDPAILTDVAMQKDFHGHCNAHSVLPSYVTGSNFIIRIFRKAAERRFHIPADVGQLSGVEAKLTRFRTKGRRALETFNALHAILEASARPADIPMRAKTILTRLTAKGFGASGGIALPE